MTDLQFEDATPVKRPFSGGRQALPNPYVDVISDIALKTNDKGEPVAKAFLLTHEGVGDTEVDVIERDRNRVTRQMSDAGKNNEPPVTVRVVFEDANVEEQKRPGQPKETTYRTKVTFWTVKRHAPRTKKTTEASE